MHGSKLIGSMKQALFTSNDEPSTERSAFSGAPSRLREMWSLLAREFANSSGSAQDNSTAEMARSDAGLRPGSTQGWGKERPARCEHGVPYRDGCPTCDDLDAELHEPFCSPRLAAARRGAAMYGR